MAGTPGSGSSTDATVDLVEPLVGTAVEQGTAVGGADVGLGGSGRVQTQSR
jgi:hypothetical protein